MFDSLSKQPLNYQVCPLFSNVKFLIVCLDSENQNAGIENILCNIPGVFNGARKNTGKETENCAVRSFWLELELVQWIHEPWLLGAYTLLVTASDMVLTCENDILEAVIYLRFHL